MVFGVFSPGRTQRIAPKKLPDKAMSIWNLHKKFQLSSAMGLRDFDLQSQPTLMGGEPINCRAMNPLTHGPMDPWTNGPMDPRAPGLMDPWIHRPMDP